MRLSFISLDNGIRVRKLIKLMKLNNLTIVIYLLINRVDVKSYT